MHQVTPARDCPAVGAYVVLPIMLVMVPTVFAGTFPGPKIDDIETASKRETAVLAGGCFWGMEAVFEHLKGVTSVVSGYAGGEKKTAHSDLVEAGGTGHAESVKITFNPSQVTYGQILTVFFSVAHDPTQLNRQGPDSGTQYRSVIFYTSDEQKGVAEAYIRQLDDAGVFPKAIVTQVAPLEGFYPAESSMQHYSQRNPTDAYVVANDLPKLEALKKEFPELYK